MCTTVLIPCNRDHERDGAVAFAVTVAVATTARVVYWAVVATWWLLELLVAALIAALVWAGPRAYRLARRVHRWYVMRPVVLDREPVAAVTATTNLPTLADLRLTRKEANVR